MTINTLSGTEGASVANGNFDSITDRIGTGIALARDHSISVSVASLTAAMDIARRSVVFTAAQDCRVVASSIQVYEASGSSKTVTLALQAEDYADQVALGNDPPAYPNQDGTTTLESLTTSSSSVAFNGTAQSVSLVKGQRYRLVLEHGGGVATITRVSGSITIRSRRCE